MSHHVIRPVNMLQRRSKIWEDSEPRQATLPRLSKLSMMLGNEVDWERLELGSRKTINDLQSRLIELEQGVSEHLKSY